MYKYTVNVCGCKVLKSLFLSCSQAEEGKLQPMKTEEGGMVEKEGGCARGERSRGWDRAQGPGVISVSALPLGTSSLRLREHPRHAYWLLLPDSHSFCLSFLLWSHSLKLIFSFLPSFLSFSLSVVFCTSWSKWDKKWALHNLIIKPCTWA